MSILLDTNVVSELRKSKTRRDTQVSRWAENLDAENEFLSVMTIAELKTGILLMQRRDRRQAAALRAWFEDDVMRGFAGRILPIDTEVVHRYAELQVPNKRPTSDALIAATALAHNLTLATRNVKDFLDTGVRLVNPWEPDMTYSMVDVRG